jgi:hypothetical protein
MQRQNNPLTRTDRYKLDRRLAFIKSRGLAGRRE